MLVMNLSSRRLGKNVIVAIVTVIVIGAAIAILGLTAPPEEVKPPEEVGPPEEEVVSVVIDDAGFVGGVGATLIRLTIRNAGTVDVKLKRITVTDTDVEGYGLVVVALKPGETAQVDVGLSKGKAKSGANPLVFTIETDKGNFEQKFTITVD
jgi:hypothetical protein